MDRKQSAPESVGAISLNIPAQLWVGNHAALTRYTKQWLATQLCPQQGCNRCTICRQVTEYQHHAVQWVYPEKRYTLEQLEPIKQALSFMLEKDQAHFFVIQKADLLSSSCANSLLKVLEEPPPGFYFILLAQRLSSILPTIISRCAVKNFYETTYIEHPLVAYFTTNHSSDTFTYHQELESSAITEQETVELLDCILEFWLTQLKKDQTNRRAQACVQIIKRSLLAPPMPGSGTLFWRNLYLQFCKR